jgi:hypothetical protein
VAPNAIEQRSDLTSRSLQEAVDFILRKTRKFFPRPFNDGN